jgi:serine/threonine protein kinase
VHRDVKPENLLLTRDGTTLVGEPAWWRARILELLGRTEQATAAIVEAYRQGRDEDYRANNRMGGSHGFHLDEPELAPLRDDPRIVELFRPKD